MRIERLGVGEAHLGAGAAGAAAYLHALVPSRSSVAGEVSEILAGVRAGGDEAVTSFTRRFDTAGEAPRPLAVAPAELDEAIKLLPLELVAGLQVAIKNVAEVAQAGAREDIAVELAQGQRIVLRELPVRSAAVYVPGGRAPYPSTVVMGVVTARAAGVLDVAVCSPPGASGEIDPTILGTCRLCGVERVYRMGGAQAIAALAYGTESIDRVDVVVGPGNVYVQEAKQQLAATVGIDGFAGPSDLMVLLAQNASEREVALAALDLLAQAEHGSGSLVIAVSPGIQVQDALASTLARLASDRPEVEGAVCAIVEVSDASAAVELANEYAPEHLELFGPEIQALAPKVRSAGCLFVGPDSATAFGDYVAGSNHVLPTAGAARFASMLSTRHFRRTMAEVRIGPDATAKLAMAGAPLARAEGFEWHARSMEARIGENQH
jgi:histidinol dehydrogenase